MLEKARNFIEVLIADEVIGINIDEAKECSTEINSIEDKINEYKEIKDKK